MAMGPVQLLVVGFDEPDFQGEVMRELGRLRESDVVRLVDLLVVRKDDEGNVEHVQRTFGPQVPQAGPAQRDALVEALARSLGK